MNLNSKFLTLKSYSNVILASLPSLIG